MANGRPPLDPASSLSDALLDRISDVVCLLDPQGRICYVNAQACRTTGYSKEEMLALDLSKLDMGLAQEGWESYRDAALRGLSSCSQRLYRTRAGTLVRLEVTASRFERDDISYLLLLAQNPSDQASAVCTSAEYYCDIFKNSPDGLYLLEVTEEGRFRNLDINPALAATMGLRAHDLIGRFVDELVSKEVADIVTAKYRRCVEAGHSTEETVELDLPAGRKWYLSTLMPVRNATGRIHRIVGISRDVTAQKQAEQAQQDIERRYRDVFDNSLDGIFLVEVTPEKRFRSIEQNAALERITGITYAQAVGHTVEETLPEPVASQVNAFYNWALETGETQQAVAELDLPGLGHRSLHTTVIPVRDATGRVYRIAGITRDITEAKRFENALRESEQRYRDIFENSVDSIYLLEVVGEQGQSFRALAVNPVFEKATGITREMAEGRLIEEILPESEAKGVIAMYRRALESGTVYEEEIEVDVPIGRRIFVTSFVPVRDCAGTIHRLLCINRDVTEKRQMEAALAKKGREFRTLVENLPENLVRYDAQGNVIYANPECCESMGLPREVMLTLNINDAPLLPGVERYRDIIMHGTATAAPEDIKLTVERPDGERRIHLMRCVTERDERGAIIGTIGIARDITELERATALLHEQAETFRALVEHSPDVIIRYDRECRRIYANPAAAATFGRPASDLLGAVAASNGPLSPMTKWFDTLRQVIETGCEREIETNYRLPNGDQCWALLRAVPEFDVDGTVMSVLSIGRDITRLKESELQYRSLAENLPDNIIRYNAAGVVTYMNLKSGDDLTGTLPTMRVGDHFDEVGEMPWSRELGEIVKHGTPSDAPVELKHTIPSPTGPRIHLVRYVTERDENGAFAGTLSIGRDITEQERAAALLHEQAETFRALVENSPDIIARYDREARRIYVNPAMARLYGATPTELVGQSAGSNSPLMQPFVVNQMVKRTLETGEQFISEVAFRNSKGSESWGHLRTVPEFDPSGDVASVLLVGRDITGLKETERRLEESRAELRELAARRESAREEERKRIAREMHDDLGQMLMALRLEITIAEHQFGNAEPRMKEKIARMMALLDRTSRVVRELVTSLRPAALDMGLVAALEWLANDFQERTGIECTLRVSAQEVPMSEERAITFFRIVQESLTNVGRYAKASRVEIGLERRAADYWLEVRDNGCGFAPDALRKAKSFGLVGIRERALALGGKAEVSSAPGSGTAIRVTIPVETTNSNEIEANQ